MDSTIDDIAREAGVSTATVSRVLNNPEVVKPATRQRVEEAIKRLDYRPNVFARGLKQSKTGIVGILVQNITNPYMTAIVEAIEETLAKNDTFIYLCNSQGSEELERRYLDELLRRRVEALMVLESPAFDRKRSLYSDVEAECPVILVNEHIHFDSPHHIVRCGQEPGLVEAFNYFLSRQLFPIALVLAEDLSYSQRVKENLFRDFASRSGLKGQDAQVHLVRNPNVEEVVPKAAALTREILRGAGRPRAILAYNDLIGVGVIQGARDLGLRVPEDLSVISVDNTFLSRISVPQLSTVDLRMGDVGRMAAELFLRIRADYVPPKAASREEIASRLVLRETT